MAFFVDYEKKNISCCGNCFIVISSYLHNTPPVHQSHQPIFHLTMSDYILYGSTGSSDTFFCLHILNRIIDKAESDSVASEIFLELDYLKKLEEIKPLYGDAMYGHTATQVIIRNGQYLGSLMEIIKVAMGEYGIEDAEIANGE